MNVHNFLTTARLQLLAGALLVLLTASAHAVVAIDWGAGAQNIVGDSDVSNAGALVGAINIDGATTSINGVTFQNLNVPGGTLVTSGNFTLASNFNVFVDSVVPPGVSSSYGSLLNSYLGGSPSVTLTMSGLTSGQTYQFQFWADSASHAGFNTLDTASAVNNVTVNANLTQTVGGLGQFAIGTFVADATGTESVLFTANTGEVFLNGFQLRNLSVVPEPSTWLAGFAALGVAAFHLRRRPTC